MNVQPSDPGCRVWLARLREPTLEELGWLTEAELVRAQRYRHAADQERSLLGAVLLRRAVAWATDVEPADVRLARQCTCGATDHGRPFVRSSRVAVSLSHSADLLAVAVRHGSPVGVDVEAVPPALDEGVCDHVMGPGDSAPAGPGEFADAWVRKEAVVKATGEGLRRPFADVRLDPDAATWEIRGSASGWWCDLDVPVGFRGALAVVGAATTVRSAWSP